MSRQPKVAKLCQKVSYLLLRHKELEALGQTLLAAVPLGERGPEGGEPRFGPRFGHNKVPKVRVSARSFKRDVDHVDHATRHCGNGVGGSEQSRVKL